MLQFGSGKGNIKVFRATGISGDKGQAYISLLDGGQLAFSLLGGFLQPLEGHFILPEVYSLLSFELVTQPVHDSLVEIITTKVGITTG